MNIIDWKAIVRFPYPYLGILHSESSHQTSLSRHSNIFSTITYPSRLDSLVHGNRDAISIIVQVQMPKHHDRGEEHGCGVCCVPALDILADVTATLKCQNGDNCVR